MTDQPSWPELQEQIIASPGQFILLVEVDEKVFRSGSGCWSGEFFQRHASLTLGIISSDQDLSSNPFGVRIKLDKCYRDSHFGSPVSDRDMVIHAAFLESAVEYRDRWLRTQHADDTHLRLIVGDQAIDAWFDLTADSDYLSWTENHDRHRPWFEKAAAALGRRLEHSPHLDAAEETERLELLKRLWEQSAKLEPHIHHIQALRRASETTGVISHGGALSVVEDEDDLRIQAMRSRQEIDRLLADLRRTLDRAKQLGLSDHPYVAAFELRCLGSH